MTPNTLNITLWVIQILLALISLLSGIFKASQPVDKLVKSGQTGVQDLSTGLIKFIGFAEILIAFGLIFPWWLKIIPILTPLAALFFGIIMILASRVHYNLYLKTGNKKERQNSINNLMILLLCLVLVIARTLQL
ncbi:MAG TPA: DoxX family protein [Bacteroidia bacterium]|jgi:hypothetical protein